MKSLGGGSLFFSASTSLYFVLKKLGIGLTIAKCAVILIVTGTLIAAGISAGMYTFIRASSEPDGRSIEAPDVKPAGNEMALPLPSVIESKKTNRKMPPLEGQKFAGLCSFTGVTVPGQVRDELTEGVYENFKLLGYNNLLGRHFHGRQQHRYLILGEIDKLNDRWTISMRIVEVSTGKIAAYVREQADIKSGFDKLSKRLSGKILKKLIFLKEAAE